MGDLSPHFSLGEFACHCGCGLADVEPALIAILERVREHYGAPVRVASGNRCPAHNGAVGGARGSQHLYGRAADIKVQGQDPTDVYALLGTWFPERYGLGLYRSWVHIDVRPGSAVRWRG